MKKFLAVLLSVVLCATVVYSVCAEEIVPEEDVIVAPETEVEDAVEDLADQLANDEVAQEKAEELIEAIQTGSSSADIVALLGALEDYVNDAGYEVSELQDPEVLKDVLNTFLDDAGVDSEALNDAISDSTSTFVDAFLGSYNGGSGNNSGSDLDSVPRYDSEDVIYQPIPDTDY